MTSCPRLAMTAAGSAAIFFLASGVLARCTSDGQPPSLSQAAQDQGIDPSVAPLPGEKAPVPKVKADPANLSGMIGLPSGAADHITFYFALPTNDVTLVKAAGVMSTPGTASYRRFFTSYQDAARTYGAKASDIGAGVRSV